MHALLISVSGLHTAQVYILHVRRKLGSIFRYLWTIRPQLCRISDDYCRKMSLFDTFRIPLHPKCAGFSSRGCAVSTPTWTLIPKQKALKDQLWVSWANRRLTETKETGDRLKPSISVFDKHRVLPNQHGRPSEARRGSLWFKKVHKLQLVGPANWLVGWRMDPLRIFGYANRYIFVSPGFGGGYSCIPESAIPPPLIACDIKE